MARLLRTIGVPVLNLLETRLYEARRQRVSAAIKLLAASDPERFAARVATGSGKLGMESAGFGGQRNLIARPMQHPRARRRSFFPRCSATPIPWLFQ